MGTGMKSLRAWIALILITPLIGACSKESDMRPTTAPQSASVALASTTAIISSAGSVKGAGGQMPAFYDGALFTINSVELPSSDAIIEHNKSMNEIYATNDLDDPQDLIPVISAIQGDGFNPLWRQNLIVFNPGFTPHQFKSDDEVLTAASGTNPEIHLIVTDEIYRCSVVGNK